MDYQRGATPTSAGNGGSKPEDHWENIMKGLSSAYALVEAPFKSIFRRRPRSTTKKSAICKHVFELYSDCNSSPRNKCEGFVNLVKKCAKVESVAASRDDPEKDSSIPIPFDLILMGLQGCKDIYSGSSQEECRKKYAKLLKQLFEEK